MYDVMSIIQIMSITYICYYIYSNLYLHIFDEKIIIQDFLLFHSFLF